MYGLRAFFFYTIFSSFGFCHQTVINGHSLINKESDPSNSYNKIIGIGLPELNKNFGFVKFSGSSGVLLSYFFLSSPFV